MTEQEWLACTDPKPMLEFLRGPVSDRKLRLFACESFRLFVETIRRCFSAYDLRLPRKDTLWNAPVVAARFADGLTGIAELEAACLAASADYSASSWLDYACWNTAQSDAWKAAVEVDMAIRTYVAVDLPPPAKAVREPEIVRTLREDTGDIWQAALIHDVFDNPFRSTSSAPEWSRWKDGVIPKLIQAIYDEREFDRLPILADALEEAGCDNADILAHCRSPGPHVRGCWVVDLLLARE